MHDRIYVAATSQHVGKTTSTLGIVAAIRNKNLNVGYCKPLGQEFVDLGDLKVDKDALLFSKTMNFELSAELHSPVILGRGVTTSFLQHPERYHFADEVMNASQKLQEMVLYLVLNQVCVSVSLVCNTWRHGFVRYM